MIKYDRLWITLKQKGISQYKLIHKYNIDKSQLHRLRKNMVVKTIILDRLCSILKCNIEDIVEYVPHTEIGGFGQLNPPLKYGSKAVATGALTAQSDLPSTSAQ